MITKDGNFSNIGYNVLFHFLNFFLRINIDPIINKFKELCKSLDNNKNLQTYTILKAGLDKQKWKCIQWFEDLWRYSKYLWYEEREKSKILQVT